MTTPIIARRPTRRHISISSQWPTPILCSRPRGSSPHEVDFEDRRYFIPRSYDEYLTLNYGDWRTPLPESQRHSHTTEAYWIDRD